MDSRLGWVAEYGYPALFLLLMVGIVGLPVPDEALLTFAGYLVSKQQLAFPPTFIAAFLGSACGITLSYGLGRGLGGAAMKRVSRVLASDPAALDHVQAWYTRRGKYALLVGYFVPGVRHVAALVVEIQSVALSDVDSPQVVLRAIEQKQAKEQQKEQKEFELIIAAKDAEIARIHAKGQGDSLRIRAHGEAESLRIRATGQAQAQEIITKTLTPNYLRFKLYDSSNSKFVLLPDHLNPPILINPGNQP